MLPSSEAEVRGMVEGFSEEPSSEAFVGFFEFFPFFQIRRGLQAFVGPVAQHASVFRAILVP